MSSINAIVDYGAIVSNWPSRFRVPVVLRQIFTMADMVQVLTRTT
jgi:hypothetical protein